MAAPTRPPVQYCGCRSSRRGALTKIEKGTTLRPCPFLAGRPLAAGEHELVLDVIHYEVDPLAITVLDYLRDELLDVIHPDRTSSRTRAEYAIGPEGCRFVILAASFIRTEYIHYKQLARRNRGGGVGRG